MWCPSQRAGGSVYDNAISGSGGGHSRPMYTAFTEESVRFSRCRSCVRTTLCKTNDATEEILQERRDSAWLYGELDGDAAGLCFVMIAIGINLDTNPDGKPEVGDVILPKERSLRVCE